jgi:ribose/xylose/arabinose/galactoside ABC-type transport system permease subunit
MSRLAPEVPAAMVERAERWTRDSVPSTAAPAASVILLRDSQDGLETYLLHRHARMAFALRWWSFLAVALTLVAGGVIGVWQGFWIAYLRVPSFIVTLAGMLLFRGATLFMLGGQPVGPFPESFRAISSGFIPELIGTIKDPLGSTDLAALGSSSS